MVAGIRPQDVREVVAAFDVGGVVDSETFVEGLCGDLSDITVSGFIARVLDFGVVRKLEQLFCVR